MLRTQIPDKFLDRLERILSPEQCILWKKSIDHVRPVCFRVNSLKTNRQDIISQLENMKLSFKQVPWYSDIIILEGIDRKLFRENDVLSSWVQEGLIYQQGLSSMFAVIALDPKPDENILDLCSAPGSKSSLIAALMNNSGRLVCVEKVKSRMYRLQSVLKILGVKNAEIVLTDGRKYEPKDPMFFDKILVDAPCSSEGRFHLQDPKSYSYWSVRKIQEMKHKQKGLIRSAIKHLKPGGTLVYSTCTFAPEENEFVVDWVLRKSEGCLSLQSISCPEGIERYSSVMSWNKKSFDDSIEKCFRILPSSTMEGFFIAKFIKA